MIKDTIAAIATAGGPIGIIRLSGARAAEAVDAVFQPAAGGRLSEQPANRLAYGQVCLNGGAPLDCCYAVHMDAPHTNTGEDMAEIQCHGSPAVLLEIMNALYRLGVRQAQAGEFTKRAFVNGKLDLSAAEAVNDLIASRTAEAAQNAAAQMMGAVGERIREVREELLDMVAHFHAVIDYPDEDIDPFLFENAQEVIHRAATTLYRLAESYERGRILHEGVPCVILGRPNTGKSTLLNTLLGRDRAIVTDMPGTTRDVIEETVRLGPVLLRVSDTAGIRDTLDPVEKEGIDRALRTASSASIILAVFDSSQPLNDDDLMVMARAAGRTSIAVVNKCDLPNAADLERIRQQFHSVIEISAKTGEGVEALTGLIPHLLGLDTAAFDGEVITNARQAAALARAASRCEEALFGAQSGMTYDAVIMDAEGAIAALGEITGQNVTEDIVEKVFDNFCVGK
ncbi:tRNA uridine-5-carboxymethylaminomethyl(34) synthesis GTPase MnmE [Butyricicoccus sp. 1XD8-22]|nr:tRNA uridine-5-carboxymethylaminomethyl(34) synthesis GTPase MnmE [Butyricicoccus sp. 1XD8-22]